MEIRKSSAPKQEPRSRKTTDATIRTDATATQPAFESDAFAVHMPTTREPILDSPVLRAKLSSPSKAQVDAYQTYKRKAQQVRDRNYQEGVRVPSRLVSYDYAYAHATPDHQALELEVSPPNNPRAPTPAGSFPSSPPMEQQGWAKPVHPPQGPRSFSDRTHVLPRKPVGSEGVKPNSSRTRYHQRVDTPTDASCSSSLPKPPTIKLRLKPMLQNAEKVQKESFSGLYNRSPQCSPAGTRSPSPSKDSFVFMNQSDRVFGHYSNDITGIVAGASAVSPPKAPKAAAKSTSRWAWLKGTSPKVSKPAPQTVTAPVLVKTMAYVDPFVLHASPIATVPSTPMASHPPSPKKLHRAQPSLATVTDKGKYESGFVQIKSFTAFLLKVCLIIYAPCQPFIIIPPNQATPTQACFPTNLIARNGAPIVLTAILMASSKKYMPIRWGFKIAWSRGWRDWW